MVSLTCAPPEMGTVPVGHVAVAVAALKVVCVAAGRGTGAVEMNWPPIDFQDTAAGARFVPATEPGPSAGTGDRPGRERARRDGALGQLARVDGPLGELGSAYRVRSDPARVDRIRGDLLATHASRS